MYNKDSLKPRNGRKLNNVIAVLMSALLATGVMIGCGSDSGGTISNDLGEVVNNDSGGAVSSNTSIDDAAETLNDSSTEVSVNEAGLPALAYKTAEERQNQKIRHFDHAGELGRTFNQYFMVEEVDNEPEGGYPEGCSNCTYLVLKGTLYEIYYYDEPAHDLIYFPGDELPEGYEVRVTEGYTFPIEDLESFGEGHISTFGSGCVTKMSESGTVEYDDDNIMFFAYTTERQERADKGLPYDDLLPFDCVVLIKPGTYVRIGYDDGRRIDGIPTRELYQYLTKEDLEKLPEGTTIADDVAHY